jgi:hypothetical protein
VGARLIALLLVLADVLLRARCLGWIDGLRRGSGLPPRNRR